MASSITALLDRDAHERRGLRLHRRNIYAGSGPITAHDAMFGEFGWETEKAHFTYPDTCASGTECGHYTQVVWRTTLDVGCELHQCPGLTYAYTIVCDYGPGGNINNEPAY